MKFNMFSKIAVCSGVLAGSIFMSGCKLTPEQSKVIAQNAGIYSAVLWISIDNPTSNQIDQVKGILISIKDNATKIESGKTYMEVVYPEVVKAIDAKVDPKDRPLCKVAAMTIINGLDTLFAMHPDWVKDQKLALQIVNSYVDGAYNGLSMSENSAIMKQARSTANIRAKTISN